MNARPRARRADPTRGARSPHGSHRPPRFSAIPSLRHFASSLNLIVVAACGIFSPNQREDNAASALGRTWGDGELKTDEREFDLRT
jgi:hypothetical protein